MRFEVRIQPRASRTEIVGEYNGAIKVRVSAPPADGAANDALVHLLATELSVARRNVSILSGASSRSKTVAVAGVDVASVEALLR